jgi:hypothetical protein
MILLNVLLGLVLVMLLRTIRVDRRIVELEWERDNLLRRLRHWEEDWEERQRRMVSLSLSEEGVYESD